MTGDNAARRAEDIGGQELSYAEVKVIASGNPAVLTLAEADAELQRLNILHKNHADEQYVARRSIRELPPKIEQMQKRLSDLAADQATAKARARDWITIGNERCPDDKAAALLGPMLDRLPKNVQEMKRYTLGTYRGLKFGIVLYPNFAPEAYLEGKSFRQTMLSRDHHGPRAVLNAIERLAGTFDQECARLRQDFAINEGQLRDYQTRYGTPFSHDAYLKELTALRDLLKAGLSGKPAEAETEPQIDVSGIAAQIKALKAAHSIDASPKRSVRRRSTAEEPVTARIRRRVTVVPAIADSLDIATMHRKVGGTPAVRHLVQAGRDR